MMLVEETTVPLSALPVAQFKDRLRLGSGFSDDGLQDSVLESYLRAAIAAIEARTGKILIERAFTWTLSAKHQGQKENDSFQFNSSIEANYTRTTLLQLTIKSKVTVFFAAIIST